MADVSLPQLGETVTEGTITKWFKAVGDQVAEDEPLFEVSTDKVDSEVPSPVSGYLTEIRVAEGETVDVGTVLAVVSDQPGADIAETPAPAAAAPTAEHTAEPAPAPQPEPESGPAGSSGDGVVLSPVVRRLVAEHGLDAATIEGTGAGGRITRDDVQRVIDGRRAPTPAAAPAAPAPVAAGPVANAARLGHVATPIAGERDLVEPLNNIRRRTGEHMVRSKATSPHAFIVMEADYEAVEAARRLHRDEFKAQEGHALTYLPFVARAMIDAIADFPHMNASVGDGELVVHQFVNLGIAVDLSYQGLIVPVIHEAQDKRLRALSQGIADLAARARSKQLSADDISGGTVTITNLGAAGTIVNLPVINQPQVMILSTEGVFRRPVVVTDAAGNEAIAIHSIGNLSLGWDHRAFDGAYSSAFLRRVVEIIETRDWTAEL